MAYSDVRYQFMMKERREGLESDLAQAVGKNDFAGAAATVATLLKEHSGNEQAEAAIGKAITEIYAKDPGAAVEIAQAAAAGTKPGSALNISASTLATTHIQRRDNLMALAGPL
jgi:hypothetical protein